MILSDRFFYLDEDYCTLEKPLGSPIFRHVFAFEHLSNSFEVTVCGLGVYELYLNCEKNGQDLLQAFCDFSRDTRVRELTRLARILMDGRRRGSDLWDKLAEEGESLWAERRRRAGEKIRLAESKMSFPLALMMIALIIITAAPAMLQMYI